MAGGYEFVKLNQVCRIIAGQSPSSDTYNTDGTGIPFFQGKTDFGNISPKVRMYCSQPIKIAEPGDILISVRAPVGPTNLCNIKSCIGRGLSAIRPSGKIDQQYLIHFLKYYEPILAQSGVGSTFKAITQADLNKIIIPLPPLKEQKKIAAILDSADAIRTKRKAAIAKLDELAQSIFLDMFGDPVKNEKGWEKISLSSITSIETGGTPSRDLVQEYYTNGTINWLKTTEVIGDEIFSTAEKITVHALKNTNCKIFPVNTIIIAMYGQGKTRGQVGVLRIESATNQACAAILPSNKVNCCFLFWMLKLSYHNLRSLSRGGNQANLNLQIIKDYHVYLPPLKAQMQFESIMKYHQKILRKHLLILSHEDTLFSSLQQRAFSGEL